MLLLFIAAALACHPECTWQCDDPVCAAECRPVCDEPVCEIQCEQGEQGELTRCAPPRCVVRCPDDRCETDECPQCETVCEPPRCSGSAVCTIHCEETSCGWACHKPRHCPKPHCELQCDEPCCQASSATRLGASLLLLLVGRQIVH